MAWTWSLVDQSRWSGYGETAYLSLISSSGDEVGRWLDGFGSLERFLGHLSWCRKLQKPRTFQDVAVGRITCREAGSPVRPQLPLATADMSMVTIFARSARLVS